MSFDVPAGRHYLETHEWADVDDGTARVGITDFAQDELGDIVFVEFPAVGTTVTAGERFGTIESIKAVSDLYAPVAGEVVAVNGEIEDRPELVNEDPFGEGWLIEIDLADDPGTEATISPEEYREQTE